MDVFKVPILRIFLQKGSVKVIYYFEFNQQNKEKLFCYRNKLYLCNCSRAEVGLLNLAERMGTDIMDIGVFWTPWF